MAEKECERINFLKTARMWLDLGCWYKGTFQLHEVTGPDEYTCLVSNNYYTNLNAQYNLHWAVRLYNLLKEAGKLELVAKKIGLEETEIAEFEKAEKAMYLPYDEELGINPQDDSFLHKAVWDFEHTPKDHYPLLLHYHPMYIYRYQVCKQADTVFWHTLFSRMPRILRLSVSPLHIMRRLPLTIPHFLPVSTVLWLPNWDWLIRHMSISGIPRSWIFSIPIRIQRMESILQTWVETTWQSSTASAASA